MVSRREKLSRSLIKLREQILERQLALLADEEPANQMSLMEMSAVIEANHGPTIYDKTFSHPDSEQHTYEDFEAIVSRISGEITEGSAQIRRDNPMRTKSTESSNSGAGAGKPEFKYERIFSDTSQSESDDSFIQNVKPVHSRRSSLSTSKAKAAKDNKKKSPAEKKSKKSMQPTASASSKTTVNRYDSSSSDDEVKLMTKSPRKDTTRAVGKSKKAMSDSDTDEDVDNTFGSKKRGSGGVRASKGKLDASKTESNDWRDSEDTQNSLDRPRSPRFRTKAAMKEFSLADMSKLKELSQSQQPKQRTGSSPSKSKSRQQQNHAAQADMSMSDSESNNVDSSIMLVPERSAARKANQKLNKKEEEAAAAADRKQRGRPPVKTADLFGDSDSDQMAADTFSSSPRKSPRVKHGAINSVISDHSEQESSSKSQSLKNGGPKLGPKNTKLKSSKASTLSESDDDFFAAPSFDKGGKASKSAKGKLVASSAGESEFDSLFDVQQPSSGPDTDSEEYLNKKREFDDFENPEMFSFVPQRKAAKKASAQLREQDMWKKTQQEAYLASLAQAQLDKVADPLKQKKSRTKKKGKSDSDSEIFSRRTRASDSSPSSDSDEPSDYGKSSSGRGKSPKGKKAGPQHSPKPSKPSVKRPRNKKSPRNSRPEGTILSSKALEYLTQRESQISNILGATPKAGREEIVDTGKDPPDKKLKTSEGRPDHSQSPPRSPKDSSDSESDSDTDDSIIAKCRPATTTTAGKSASTEQPELGTAAAGLESKEAEDRLAGRRPGDKPDISSPTTKAERRPQGSIKVRSGDELLSDSCSTTAQGQQQSAAAAAAAATPEKSIFSPERSPRVGGAEGIAAWGSGRRSPASHEGKSPAGFGSKESLIDTTAILKDLESPPKSWSPRERKLAESSARSPRVASSPRERGREIFDSTKTPTKSPSLNRSFDSVRNSPHLLKSPTIVQRSPSLGGKDAGLAKNTLHPNELPPKKEVNRKFSVDSDADSAKSSLPDADNLLQDIGKDDSTDTLELADKLSEASAKTDPSKASSVNHAKTDEGYVSAEKPVTTGVPTPVSVFENTVSDAIKKKEVVQSLDGFGNNNEKPVSPPKGGNLISAKSLEAFSQQQQQQQQQQEQQQQQQQHNLTISSVNNQADPSQKAAEDMAARLFQNHQPNITTSTAAAVAQEAAAAAAAAAPTSLSSTADLQQYLQQQQQLQQQMYLQHQDSRNWTTPFTSQPEQLSSKHQKALATDPNKAALDSLKGDKKNTDLAKQQMYNMYQMLNMQSKHMTQAQQMVYAQQYMKVKASFQIESTIL